MDPPAGTRLRRLVAQAFTAERMEALRPRTEAVVEDLLDRMEQEGSPADLMKHLADPLPLTSICEFLRIEESDRDWLRGHARTLMDTRPERHEDASCAKQELRAYFADLTADRRARPGDDLISVLAQAREGSEVLDDDELTVMAMVLLITGQDTTTYQIGNIAYTLLSRPHLPATLRERPELLEPALDEILRFVPFRKGVGIPRVALQDVELGGVTIRAGDFVHVSYLTANRDPRKFAAPHRLDTTRVGPQHMTFGWGSHHCLGAPLALLELRTAFTRLLERFPSLELAVPAERIAWNASSIWRYPTALPVTW
jgi:cytochrome P450